MIRKYLLVVLFLILAIFLSGCWCCLCNRLLADVVIEDWEQNYDDDYGWDPFVKVQYKICNTGDIEISHYIVWFTAYCEDGSTYEHWANGIWLYVGDCNSGTCYVKVGPNKKVISVRATDRELEHWDYPNQ